MQKIHDWKATRSGLTITITGKDETGKHLKVAGVTEIVAGKVVDDSTGLRTPPTAVTEPGLEYELV